MKAIILLFALKVSVPNTTIDTYTTQKESYMVSIRGDQATVYSRGKGEFIFLKKGEFQHLRINGHTFFALKGQKPIMSKKKILHDNL